MVLDSLAGAEVVQLEQLPDLDVAILVMGVGAALDPRDRFRKRLTLQDPVARYQFLDLREWAVYHLALVAGEPYSSALGTWLQPIAIEQINPLTQALLKWLPWRGGRARKAAGAARLTLADAAAKLGKEGQGGMTRL
jgi:hypothetical protein